MPLEHVSIWHDGVGWGRILAKEAEKLFSSSVSANERMFICDLCHKHVSFVNSSQQESHFRHNSGDPDKDCDDRTQAFSRSEQDILRSTITCPLRIEVNAGSFYLKIGFLPLPADIMALSKASHLQARVFAGERLILTKDINRSNFSTDETVYHSIDYISEEYFIKTSPDEASIRLPLLNRKYPGINRSGTLFDYKTGKKIPIDGDIEVGKTHYLLIPNYYIGQQYGIDIKKIASKDRYCLYTVSANVVSKSTTEFYLRFAAHLTNVATQLIPVWPILHEGDHLIKTDHQTLFFLLKGDSSIKVEPTNARTIDVYKLDSYVQLVCVNNASGIRMVWAARLSVLRYLNLYHDSNSKVLSIRSSAPILIQAEDQTIFNDGIYHVLPRGRRLFITTGYDGKIVCKRNSEQYFSKRTKAAETVVLDKVAYGDSIDVYHGLDKVASIQFARPNQVRMNDNIVLSQLKSCIGDYVDFPHRYGSIIPKLSTMPNTKYFLLKAKQKGSIRIDAVKLLRKIVVEG